MHWELEITLLIFGVTAAWLSIATRSLLTSAVTLTVFSFLMALSFVTMGAIDVGFTEAVVGAGVTGIFIIIAIFKTARPSPETSGSRFRVAKLAVLFLFGALLIYGSTGLPDRGNANAPLNHDPSAAGTVNAASYYIQNAYEDAATPNMVTVILADYRGYDTLGEEIVILAAGLICFLVLRTTRERRERERRKSDRFNR
jgi:multicomponent Na+:H+ antiporter subunit B